MELLVSTFSVILPVLTVTFVSSLFMKKVYQVSARYSKKVYVLLWTAFLLGYIGIIYCKLGSIVMTLFGFIMIQWISCFYLPYHNKFLYTSFFYLYLMLMDLVSLPIISFIFHIETKTALTEVFPHFFTAITSSVLMLLSCNAVISLLSEKKSERIQRKINFLFLFLLFLEAEILVYMTIKSKTQGYVLHWLIVAIVFFVLLDILGIYLYNLIRNESKKREELMLAKQKDELELRHLRELELQYEKSRKIIHDMKNYVVAIWKLKNQSNDNFDTYVQEILQKMDEIGYRFKSSSEILTILISDKIEKAKNKEIQININVKETNFGFISDLDWVVILGNLLDNAIEACQISEREEKKIDLYIHEFQRMLIIKLENTSKEVDCKNGVLQSSKKNHTGLGLVNVRETLKKYDGSMDFDYEDFIFKTRIIIPVQ